MDHVRVERLMKLAKHPIGAWYVPYLDFYLVKDEEMYVLIRVSHGVYHGAHEYHTYTQALEAVAHSLAGLLNSQVVGK